MNTSIHKLINTALCFQGIPASRNRIIILHQRQKLNISKNVLSQLCQLGLLSETIFEIHTIRGTIGEKQSLETDKSLFYRYVQSFQINKKQNDQIDCLVLAFAGQHISELKVSLFKN